MTLGGSTTEQAKSKTLGPPARTTTSTTILTSTNDPEVRWRRINREWKRCRHTYSRRRWITQIGTTYLPLQTTCPSPLPTTPSPPTHPLNHPPTSDTPTYNPKSPYTPAESNTPYIKKIHIYFLPYNPNKRHLNQMVSNFAYTHYVLC